MKRLCAILAISCFLVCEFIGLILLFTMPGCGNYEPVSPITDLLQPRLPSDPGRVHVIHPGFGEDFLYIPPNTVLGGFTTRTRGVYISEPLFLQMALTSTHKGGFSANNP